MTRKEIKNTLIVKSNKLIEGRYNLDTWEIKIIAKLSSLVQRDDEDFKEFKFYAHDLLEELNLGDNNYLQLSDTINKLVSKQVRIQQDDNKKILITNFLSSCLYDSEDSSITLSFDPKLKPYYLQLKNNFTKYHLETVLELKSFYSYRIYELLKQYEQAGKREVSITELRLFLGIDDKKSYDLYGNIKNRILKIAIDEINDKTDLIVSFKEIKSGRSVYKIEFKIKSKEKKKKSNKLETIKIKQINKYLEKPNEIEKLQVKISKKLLEKGFKVNSRENIEVSSIMAIEKLKEFAEKYEIKIDF